MKPCLYNVRVSPLARRPAWSVDVPTVAVGRDHARIIAMNHVRTTMKVPTQVALQACTVLP